VPIVCIHPDAANDALAPWGESTIRLDSGPSGPYSRWSYRLGSPIARLHCDAAANATYLRQNGQSPRSWTDPLAALHWMAAQLTATVSPGPPFKGGWVGFLSYDLGRFFETLPTRCTDDLHWPLFDFTYHDVLVAHDNLDNRSYLITPDNARAPYNPACTCGASESTAAPATPLPSPNRFQIFPAPLTKPPSPE